MNMANTKRTIEQITSAIWELDVPINPVTESLLIRPNGSSRHPSRLVIHFRGASHATSTAYGSQHSEAIELQWKYRNHARVRFTLQNRE